MVKRLDTPLGRLNAYDGGTDEPEYEGGLLGTISPDGFSWNDTAKKIGSALTTPIFPGPRQVKPDAGNTPENAAAITKKILDTYRAEGKILSDDANLAIAEVVRKSVLNGAKSDAITKAIFDNPAKAIKDGNDLIAVFNPSKAPSTDPLIIAGMVPLANGNYYNPQKNSVIDKDGNLLKAEPLQTAAQEAASYASAQANVAQAGYYGAQAQHIAQVSKLVGTSPQAGYIYDADGKLQRTDEPARDKAIYEENGRHNLATEIDNIAKTANEKEYQQGSLANDRGRLSNEITKTGNEKEYQQATLAQGNRRLNLEEKTAATDAAIKSQQNALAKQKYIGDVLSRPSDFVARAFGLSGEGQSTGGVTQADLINQINTEYNKNPVTFAAPQAPPPNNLQPQQYANGTGSGRLANTYVNDRLAVVGDPQADGGPNPEVINNPTGAPISVTPMRDLQGASAPANAPRLAQGTQSGTATKMQQMPEDPRIVELTKKVDGLSKALQHIDTPDIQHALVDELAGHKSRLASLDAPKGMPAYADGTDGESTYKPYVPPGSVPLGHGYYTDANGGAGNPSDTGQGNTPGMLSTPPSRLSIGSSGPLSESDFRTAQLGLIAAKAPVTPATPLAAPPVTQEDIIKKTEANMPLRLRQLFGGSYGQNYNTATGQARNPWDGSVSPGRLPFNLFTPEALGSLTTAEQEALNSYLGVKYNSSLADVMTLMKQSFGSPSMRRGRLTI